MERDEYRELADAFRAAPASLGLRELRRLRALAWSRRNYRLVREAHAMVRRWRGER